MPIQGTNNNMACGCGSGSNNGGGSPGQSLFLGIYPSLQNLQTAQPTPVEGNYAYVSVAGDVDDRAEWDSAESKWYLATESFKDIRKTFSLPADFTFEDVLQAINNLEAYQKKRNESIWFVGRQYTQDLTLTKTVKYKLLNKGRGTYGAGGIEILEEDLELVYNGTGFITDVINDPETDNISFGNIGATPVQNWLNAKDPAIEIQPITDGLTFFKGIINNASVTYLWKGGPGTYGSGMMQATSADFEILESEPLTSLIPLLYDNVTGDNVNGAPTQKAVKLALADKPSKESNSEYSSPLDSIWDYRPAFWNKVGKFIKLDWAFFNDNTKEFSLKGSSGRISPHPNVTDGAWRFGTITGAGTGWVVEDGNGLWFSVGTTVSGKRVYNHFPVVRHYNYGSTSFIETEYIAVDCPAATAVQLLKAITIPTDSSLTIDINNLNTFNADSNGIRGRAQFFVKNVGGVVTDVSVDALRYNSQHSFVKSASGAAVTNADARIDISITGTTVNVNFLNQGTNQANKLTTIHCEIRFNITSKPI